MEGLALLDIHPGAVGEVGNLGVVELADGRELAYQHRVVLAQGDAEGDEPLG